MLDNICNRIALEAERQFLGFEILFFQCNSVLSCRFGRFVWNR